MKWTEWKKKRKDKKSESQCQEVKCFFYEKQIFMEFISLFFTVKVYFGIL